MTLRRVQDAAEDLRWLSTADPDGGFTGFDVDLWPASTHYWFPRGSWSRRSRAARSSSASG
ncbi:hypothetical protein [Nocardioides sp. SYSU DS0651]|uniref:hypothetical protein n=1 Tax=Nocardioides sp. SYSU DS0651 TaxID=3415955 RepID=UPI003F4BEF08